MDSLEENATTFIKFIIKNVVQGTIESVRKLLNQGPPGRTKDPREIELQKWFLNLENEDRKKVMEVVQSSVRQTTFNMLVVLDNKVGYPIEDVVSDFALSLQTYENQEALFTYRPIETKRLNMSYSINGDLHDLLLSELFKEKSNMEKG